MATESTSLLKKNQKTVKSRVQSSTTVPDGKKDEHFKAISKEGVTCLKCIQKEAATTRAKAHIFLEGFTPAGKCFEYVVLFLILGNIGTFVISTEPYFHTPMWKSIFGVIEDVTVFVFTIEFFFRSWSIVEDPKWTRCNYFFSFYSIVDFLAIFPWWIDLLTPKDLIPTTFIRILRLFRLFKAEHYIEAFTTFDNVYARHRHLLQSTGFIMLILWVIMSVGFYLTEKDNPTVNGQFDNIPSAMFFTAIFFNGEWAYCDFTIYGKFLGAFMCILGIAIFAIPVGILSEGFQSVTEERKAERKKLAGSKLICDNKDCAAPLAYIDFGRALGRLEDEN